MRANKNLWTWVAVIASIIFLILIIVFCTCYEKFANSSGTVKLDELKRPGPKSLNGNLKKVYDLWVIREKKKYPNKSDEEHQQEWEHKVETYTRLKKNLVK